MGTWQHKMNEELICYEYDIYMISSIWIFFHVGCLKWKCFLLLHFCGRYYLVRTKKEQSFFFPFVLLWLVMCNNNSVHVYISFGFFLWVTCHVLTFDNTRTLNVALWKLGRIIDFIIKEKNTYAFDHLHLKKKHFTIWKTSRGSREEHLSFDHCSLLPATA